MTCILFWVNDGLRSRYLWLHKPTLYRLSYIHHINPTSPGYRTGCHMGVGVPVYSGLRGTGGYRAHSSGFSVQRNHLICHRSKTKKSESFGFGLFKVYCFRSIYTFSKSHNTLPVPNLWILNHLFDLLKCLCVRFVVISLYIKNNLLLFLFYTNRDKSFKST